jgi:redox-sensitive bicupin YhaK (pirin superfamily)
LTRTDDDGLSEVNIAGGTAPLRVLLYAGRPLREPVVARGPFVLNTEEQIRQANIDYREGPVRTDRAVDLRHSLKSEHGST